MPRLHRYLALTAAAALCSVGTAQTSSQSSRGSDSDWETTDSTERQDDRSRATQKRNRQARTQQAWNRQDAMQRNADGQGGRSSPLDWESTTIVGYDLDADGVVDAYYAASTYEVERMRRRAEDQRRGMSARDRERMDRERSRAMADRATRDRTIQQRDRQRQAERRAAANRDRTRDRAQQDRWQREQDQRRRAMDSRWTDRDRAGNDRPTDRMNRQNDRQRQARRNIRTRGAGSEQARTLSGTIRGMKDFNLTGIDGSRTVARVETDRGQRVAVILGDADRVDELDLNRGDTVRLRVRQGSINNRHVLVADRLRVNGRTERLEQQKTDNLKRIRGEIVATRTENLRTPEGRTSRDHLLLKIRNDNGRVSVVSLGPVSRVDEDRLQRGEDVCVLASPTRLNGQHAYEAHKVSHDGETKTLSAANRRERDERTSRAGMRSGSSASAWRD